MLPPLAEMRRRSLLLAADRAPRRRRASRSSARPAGCRPTSPAPSASRSDFSRPTAASTSSSIGARMRSSPSPATPRRRSSRSGPSPAGCSIRPPSISIRPTAASSSPTRRCGDRASRLFTADGRRLAGFTLAEREKPRLLLDNDRAERHRLDSVHGRPHPHQSAGDRQRWCPSWSCTAHPMRTFGQLRPTGQKADENVHLALNAGLPLADPTGGYYFVFSAGDPDVPEVRREGHAPVRAPHRRPGSGRLPADDADAMADAADRGRRRAAGGAPGGQDRRRGPRGAAVDRADVARSPTSTTAAGDKVRTVQFRGASLLSPNSLFFTKDGRVLVTPGCYEFRIANP